MKCNINASRKTTVLDAKAHCRPGKMPFAKYRAGNNRSYKIQIYWIKESFNSGVSLK